DPVTGDTTNFRVVGVDPVKPLFEDPTIQHQLRMLREPDTALIDRRMRDFTTRIEQAVQLAGHFPFEALGRQMEVLGLFSQGASFDVDGNLIVSDQTFFRLFPNRSAGTPTLVLVNCNEPGAAQRIAHQLNDQFPETDTRAITRAQ